MRDKIYPLTIAGVYTLFVIVVLCLMASGAFGAESQFVVVNKVPPTFTVVNKVPSATSTDRFTATDGVTYERCADGVYRAVPEVTAPRPFYSTVPITAPLVGGRSLWSIPSTGTERTTTGVRLTAPFGRTENCPPSG